MGLLAEEAKLNNLTSLIPTVSLNVMTAVTSKTTNERFWIIFELFFLKTPNISRNIIDKDKKISGKTNCRFVIISCSLI